MGSGRPIWTGYCDILKLPVANDHDFQGVTWEGGLLRLTFRRPDGSTHVHYARKLVLATGIEGCGSWHVPDFVRDGLPRARYAHTSENIDFAALKGKRIGVLGAGASAFDNAATALEDGAGSVTPACGARKSRPSTRTGGWKIPASRLLPRPVG